MIYDDSFFMQRQVDMSSVFDLQKGSDPPFLPIIFLQFFNL